MEQMIRMTITIGFNDKDTKFQLYPNRVHYEKIDELLKLNTIEAATLSKCEGYYKGTKENSMQVVLYLLWKMKDIKVSAIKILEISITLLKELKMNTNT